MPWFAKSGAKRRKPRGRWVRWLAAWLGVGLLLLAVWVVAHGNVRSRLEAWVRAQLRAQLPPACDFGATHLTFFPPGLVVANLHCPPPLTEIESLRAELDVAGSVRSLAVSVSLYAARVLVDVAAPGTEEGWEQAAHREEPEPWFVVPVAASVYAETIAVRLPYGDEVAEVSAGDVMAGAHISPSSVWVELATSRAAWRRGRWLLEAEELALRARQTASGWQLEEAEIRGQALQSRAWRGNGEATEFWLAGPAETLAFFVEALSGLKGTLEARGRLAGNVFDPLVSAELVVEHPGYEKLRGERLRASLVRAGAVLELNSVFVEFPEGQAVGDVAFLFGDGVSLQSALDWQCSGALHQCGLLLGEGSPWNAWVAGASVGLAAAGTLDPHHLVWSGVGAIEVGRQEAGVAHREVRWKAWAESANGRVWWGGEAENSELGSMHTQGTWKGEEVTLAARLQLPAVENWIRWLPGLALEALPDVDGGAEVEVAASGWPPDVHWRANVLSAALRVEKVPLPLWHCSAEGVGGRWRLEDCRAGSADMGWVEATRVGLENWTELRALRVLAQSFSLQPLAAWLSERLRGGPRLEGGRISGAFQWPAVEEQRFRIEDLSVGGELLREIRLSVAPRTGGAWAITVEAQHERAGRMELRWLGTSDATGELQLSIQEGDVGALKHASTIGLGGRLEASGRVRMKGLKLQGVASFDLRPLVWRGWDFGAVSGTVDFQDRSWVLRAAAMSGECQLTARIEPGQNFPFRAELTVGKSRPLALARGDVRLAVRAAGEAAGMLSPARVDQGAAELELLEIRAATRVVRTARPVRIQLAGGRISSSTAEFELPRGRATMAIGGEIDRGLEITANVQSELEWVRDVFQVPGIVGGSASASARLYYGRPTGWNVQAEFRCTSCSFERQGMPAVSDVSAIVRLQGSALTEVSIVGSLGGGKFVVEGGGSLEVGPSLRWTVEDAALEGANGWEASVDAHGTVAGTWAKPLVSGDVIIQRAEYSRDVELVDLLRWIQEKIVAPTEPRAQRAVAVPVVLDLKVYSTGGVFIENNVADVELWVDTWLSGPANDPQIGGKVGVLGGEVKFQGRTFTLDFGKIEFRDPLSKDPVLDLAGETEIRTPSADYLVVARVEGTASAPRVQLTADDPTLTQADLVALVLFGRTRAEFQAGGGSFSPVGAALALLPTGAVQRPVTQWLGIDRFEVGASQTADASTLEPKVTIGKALTDQLHAVLWTTVGSLTRQAVQLEYRIGRRVSLLGSWESGTTTAAGAFGGDIKFRVETYRVPFSLCRRY